jgi:hypothetical protein
MKEGYRVGSGLHITRALMGGLSTALARTECVKNEGGGSEENGCKEQKPCSEEAPSLEGAAGVGLVQTTKRHVNWKCKRIVRKTMSPVRVKWATQRQIPVV